MSDTLSELVVFVVAVIFLNGLAWVFSHISDSSFQESLLYVTVGAVASMMASRAVGKRHE